MNRRNLSRCISGCLSLALVVQLGTASAFLAETPDAAAALGVEETGAKASALTPEDQAKWDQLATELGANGNPTSQYINVHDGQPKVILWTQGITPPTIGEADSQLKPTNDPTGAYLTYQTEYIPGQGWYDVNKNGGPDANLCFGAAASNSLHWWLNQNNKYVQRFIASNPDDPTCRPYSHT